MRRYKKAGRNNIWRCLGILFLCLLGYGVHFHGMMISEEALTEAHNPLLGSIHVTNYGALFFSCLLQVWALSAIFMIGIVKQYYECGGLFYPTERKLRAISCKASCGR